jgi:hypothetical protein
MGVVVEAKDAVVTVAKKVNGQEGWCFFKFLFDSCSTSVMINKRVLPKDCEIYEQGSKSFTTTQGTFSSPGFDGSLFTWVNFHSQDQEDKGLHLLCAYHPIQY